MMIAEILMLPAFGGLALILIICFGGLLIAHRGNRDFLAIDSCFRFGREMELRFPDL